MHDDTFHWQVTDMGMLRALIGEPGALARAKAHPQLDAHCRAFIAHSPLVFVGTTDASGQCDVSPRGDAPGCVQIVDARHLLIPERPGSRRADTLGNLLACPAIGLLFVIPGVRETLRVNGSACLTRDPRHLATLAVHNKTPVLAIGVTVAECYLHCGKAFIRSHIWEPETWLAEGERPDAAQIFVDHAQLPAITLERSQTSLAKDYCDGLY